MRYYVRALISSSLSPYSSSSRVFMKVLSQFSLFYRSFRLHCPLPIARIYTTLISPASTIVLYLISVFSHSKFVESIARTRINRVCPSSISLQSSRSCVCIIKIKFFAFNIAELWNGTAESRPDLQRAQCLEILRCPSSSTRSGQPNSMEASAQER